MLGEHGDRELVTGRGLICLKHDTYRPEVPRKPPLTINIHLILKMKGRRGK
jgi:hypothetical protein